MAEYTFQAPWSTPGIQAELFDHIRTNLRDRLIEAGPTWGSYHFQQFAYPMYNGFPAAWYHKPVDEVMPLLAAHLARPAFQIKLANHRTWVDSRPDVIRWLKVKLPATGFHGDVGAKVQELKYAANGWDRHRTEQGYRGRITAPYNLSNLMLIRVFYNSGSLAVASHIRNTHTLEVR
jgi:hypothetical protein